MTKYIVFQKITDADSDWWDRVGEYDGRNAREALTAAILAMPAGEQEQAGSSTFAVTAVSCWQVLTPTVSVETRVAF